MLEFLVCEGLRRADAGHAVFQRREDDGGLALDLDVGVTHFDALAHGEPQAQRQ